MEKNSIPLFLLSLAIITSAGPVIGADIESLGSLEFPNSGAVEAQEPFIRGVLLLHSFEYDDAREAFLAAQEIDPDFHMAYWGEAMTHNHPLWRRQDRAAARAVLERLPAGAPSRREQGYLDALRILYGDGDKVSRDFAYSEAMGALSQRHPDDLEAKSFYALSILGTTQAVRDFRAYMRAGAVVEEVFAANPRHPGAAHYLIHSYDDPIHAPLGLRAARVYADIAPAASHAQHMISHIYVALGRWSDSVESNVQSFEVSEERVERKGLGVDDLNFHAYHWLQYSYLQLGRWQVARQMLDRMHGYALESGSMRARGYYAAMRASWLTETGDIEIPPSLGTTNTGPTSAAADLFASGYRALTSGRAGQASTAVESLETLLAEQPTTMEDSVATERRRVIEVLTWSLQSQIALAAGREREARDLLTRATAAEASMPLEYGPPAIVKPSHELFGETLLQIGEPEAAAMQLTTALERAPRRRAALWGQAQAAAALGEATVVEASCAELARILIGADVTVGSPAVCPTP